MFLPINRDSTVFCVCHASISVIVIKVKTVNSSLNILQASIRLVRVEYNMSGICALYYMLSRVCCIGNAVSLHYKSTFNRSTFLCVNPYISVNVFKVLAPPHFQAHIPNVLHTIHPSSAIIFIFLRPVFVEFTFQGPNLAGDEGCITNISLHTMK